MRIVVVGAGVIGLAVAEALSKRGAEVIVLEKRGPGRGASAASAGILAPYTEADDSSPLFSLGARSLALYDDFVRGASDRSGRSIEYSRSGTLEVALDTGAVDHLTASRARLEQLGVACQWLDATELRQLEPAVTPAALGGLVIAQHGYVGVGTLIAALLQSARLAGAVFESPTDVAALNPHGQAVEIRIGTRKMQADRVVVAAGSWSGQVRMAGAPSLPVRPVRGQLLHVRPPERACPSRVVWGPDCYLVPWSDQTMLIGATVEEVGFDEQTTVGGVSQLAAAATRLLPDTALSAIVETRVGLRPATPDGLPLIGFVPGATAICVATGHYRNGILLAPITADLVSRLLLDDVTDDALEATRLDRF